MIVLFVIVLLILNISCKVMWHM